MGEMQFELVSPEGLVFSGLVASVLMSAAEGEMMVLPGHAPFMSTLHPAVLKTELASGIPRKWFVRGGFVDVAASGLTILAEHATLLDSVDPVVLEAQIKDAQEDFSDAKDPHKKEVAAEKLSQLRELHQALQA